MKLYAIWKLYVLALIPFSVLCFPFTPTITDDFPYRFVTETSCNNENDCGKCQKLEVTYVLQDKNNCDLKIACVKCSQGFPTFGSFSGSYTRNSSDTFPDPKLDEMCTWYSKGMVYALIVLIVAVLSLVCYKQCFAKKTASYSPPADYWTTKPADLNPNASLDVDPSTAQAPGQTPPPLYAPKPVPQGLYSQPNTLNQPLIKPHGSIFTNTARPP